MKKFFSTAGKGIETFLATEIAARLDCSNIEANRGKVFFATRSTRDSLLKLKSAERLFVHVLTAKPEIRLANIVNASFSSEKVWQAALDTWKEMQEEETEEPPSKKQRQESPSLTFRVSCKCAGRAGKRIRPQVLGARLGALISSKFGLKPDLRRPSLEVSVHLNDEGLVIGLPVSKVPLSSRSYIRTSGLRSTVAWTLARLADIKVGNIVLDPMCGTASILIEAAIEWKDAFYIGSDVSSSQLEIASTNVQFAGTSNVHLLRTDATDLSLLGASSIDRVICDMPFGLQHGSQELIRELYPAFAQELCRIMSLDGRVVLLSSLENQSFLKKTIENADTFIVHDTHQMSLGDLQAVAVVLIRKCNTEFVL